jgi:hypothetical protein
LGEVDWIRLAQERDWWRAVASAVMNLRVFACVPAYLLTFLSLCLSYYWFPSFHQCVCLFACSKPSMLIIFSFINSFPFLYLYLSTLY